MIIRSFSVATPNGDGKFDVVQATKFLQEKLGKSYLLIEEQGKQKINSVPKWFAEMDKNNDGFLDEKELDGIY